MVKKLRRTKDPVFQRRMTGATLESQPKSLPPLRIAGCEEVLGESVHLQYQRVRELRPPTMAPRLIDSLRLGESSATGDHRISERPDLSSHEKAGTKTDSPHR